MKSLHSYFKCVGVLVLVVLLLQGMVYAQDEKPKKKKTRHRIGYFNIADSIKYFQSYLYVSSKGVKTEIDGAKVKYYAVSDTGQVFIGESVSDINGKAKLLINDEMQIPVDTSGQLSIIANFEGNEFYNAKDVDIEVKELVLDVNYSEKDSIKKVVVRASNALNGKAIKGIDIQILVERLFNPLLIDEISTNKKGKATLEFPNDLPGDENGSLNLIVLVDDDNEYGNYKAYKTIAWGVPLEKRPEKLKRALWSPNAPLWMVIVFAILMAAVWGHYLYIGLALNKVKRENKSNSSEIRWDS